MEYMRANKKATTIKRGTKHLENEVFACFEY